MTKPIQFVASECTIQAEAGAIPKFKIVAYTGGPLSIASWERPVAVDLASLDTSKPVTVNLHHDQTKLVGHSVEIETDGKRLIINGVVSAASPEATQFIESSKKGFPWQASIEATPGETEVVDPGKRVAVNGQSIAGPAYIARKAQLYGVAFVAKGADPNTEVSLAAQQAKNKKGYLMETFDASKIQAAATKAQADLPAQLAEMLGPVDVTAAATEKGLADIEAAASCALAGEWEMSQLQDKLHSILCATKLSIAQAKLPKAPAIRASVTPAENVGLITAALCLNAGIPAKTIEAAYGQRVVDAATGPEFRGMGLHSLMHGICAQAGRPLQAGARFGDSAIRTAFECDRQLQASGMSTVSLSGILSNVQNKAMLSSFMATESLADKICGVTDAKDFKPFKRYRMTGVGDAPTLGNGGLIKHIALSDESYSGQIQTRAAMLAVSREDIINDDLGALAQAPTILGRMAFVAREKAVFTALLAAEYFTSGNGNYIEGSTTNLSITSLATGVQKFRQQVDSNGDPILVSPAILIVPPELETTGDNLLAESNVVVTVPGSSGGPLTAPSRNPHAGKYELAVSPYLSNSNISGYSTTAWYLFANPNDVPALLIAYLNGNRVPTVEPGDVDFNQLGLAFRVIYDFGVAQGDHRGAFKSKGAA